MGQTCDSGPSQTHLQFRWLPLARQQRRSLRHPSRLVPQPSIVGLARLSQLRFRRLFSKTQRNSAEVSRTKAADNFDLFSRRIRDDSRRTQPKLFRSSQIILASSGSTQKHHFFPARIRKLHHGIALKSILGAHHRLFFFRIFQLQSIGLVPRFFRLSLATPVPAQECFCSACLLAFAAQSGPVPARMEKSRRQNGNIFYAEFFRGPLA